MTTLAPTDVFDRVVEIDGPDDSVRAYQTASDVSERFGSEVRAVVATRDPGVDIEAARRTARRLEECVFSRPSDLLVVGSRGLRRVRALGSLGERPAQESRSSVLVVRDGG
jgi:nucleotide-binding universal stress UspA family protein